MHGTTVKKNEENENLGVWPQNFENKWKYHSITNTVERIICF
jgi:hypothetical protein